MMLMYYIYFIIYILKNYIKKIYCLKHFYKKKKKKYGDNNDE